MAEVDNNTAQQIPDPDTADNPTLAGEKQLAGGTEHVSGLTGEIGKEFAQMSAALQHEAASLGADAVDLVKHPRRYAEVGASLAEGAAGESVGEILGAALGTVFGPEGTVIGAELGGMAGEVFGARQGGKLADKLLHQPETERPLTEDIQKEGSAKAGSHAGKIIGGIIGDALLDDAGCEIGEAVGDKIGKLAGSLAFEHIAKKPVEHRDAPPASDVSQTDTDGLKD